MTKLQIESDVAAARAPEFRAVVKMPECEKMAAVQVESRAISGFLGWLDEQGIELCERAEGSFGGNLFPILTGREELLARYFDIDLVKVENERRALLASLR
jgi:hypothetical protein